MIEKCSCHYYLYGVFCEVVLEEMLFKNQNYWKNIELLKNTSN